MTVDSSNAWPKSRVTGALVWTNIPYPLLLIKKGTGLYIRAVWTPIASLVYRTTLWPRLLSLVNDSPQPKIFSSGDSRKLAAILRPRSIARLTNENGTGWEKDLVVSPIFIVRVNSLPAPSRISNRQGFLIKRTRP